jgi:hypothetical protein
VNLVAIACKMALEPEFVKKLQTDPAFLTRIHESPADAAAIQLLLSQEELIKNLLDAKSDFLLEGYPWYAQEKMIPNS